ncbi:MAG: hypothetical protein JWO41_957 [Candidatus Saccharibacteria bacterium]|nr:hypothetical protein [Candidatus Saccharibacteria bacterium]
MTEIKFRTPEVIAAEEQARKAALQQAFASRQPVAIPTVERPVVPQWNELATPAVPAPTPVAEASAATATTVSINISLPTISADKAKNITLKLLGAAQAAVKHSRPYLTHLQQKAALAARHMPYRSVAKASAVLALGIGLVAGSNHLWQNHQTARQEALTAAATAKVKQQSTVTVKPAFKPVTPAAKTELADGEAGKTSYDTAKKTFSYADSIKGMDITVSQQPLPTSFGSAEKAVTSIAKSLSATQAVVTNRGTGYIATDPKSHAQTVVYSFNNLLIFINSPFSQQSGDWKVYLENLKQN